MSADAAGVDAAGIDAADAERTARLERAEAEALASLTLAAPPALARALGLHLVADEGAVATLAPAADVLSLNRVLALGTGAPAGRAQLGRLVDAARARGVRRLFVQLPPAAAPAELPEWVAALGGRPYNRWVRLRREAAAAPAAPTTLRVAPLGLTDAAAFGAVVTGAFGMPPSFVPWIGAVVGRPGWRCVGAFDGDALVATGALHASGETGWLGLAATRLEYRGRGAQGALVAWRVAEAARAGCRELSVETAEGADGAPGPSHRNMLRHGFVEAYRRQNWLLTLAEPPG